MKKIPNILTLLRIISVPFIVILFINNEVWLTIFLTIIIAATDCLDGFLARKFNAQTELGAMLDATCDKIFSAGLLLTIATKFHILFLTFGLEIIISIISLFFYSKTRKSRTIFIGKVKTWFLFATVTMGFIVYFNPNIILALNIFVIITGLLQLCCIYGYIKSGIYLTTHRS